MIKGCARTEDPSLGLKEKSSILAKGWEKGEL
jgi:hypothetical protein